MPEGQNVIICNIPTLQNNFDEKYPVYFVEQKF